MTRSISSWLKACMIAALAASTVGAQTVKELTPKVFLHADVKLRASVRELGSGDTLRFPRATKANGEWGTVPITDWTSGFVPGCLWYLYEYSKDSSIRSAAERWTGKLEPIEYFTGNHDIGFMIFNSYGNAYRLTGNPAYKQVVLQAARTAMKRYNPRVGCIKSWENQRWQYPVIIDNMMNLELLFWAVQQGEDSSLYRAAVSHAEHTMKNHFRADGSTFHVVNYDTATGNTIGGYTAQGYADSSVWARGQAWSIYGFTMAYRYTRDERFLHTAERAAGYFIAHLPEDHIPYWDFKAPNIPNEPRDASAAAVAACGLLELSTMTANAADAKKYFSEAESMIRSLASGSYSAEGSPSRGITLHSVTSKPAGAEVDVTLIYADYYLLEALLKYRGLQRAAD
jgi:unsaturated chondroitin disaccharide hydrolase